LVSEAALSERNREADGICDRLPRRLEFKHDQERILRDIVEILPPPTGHPARPSMQRLADPLLEESDGWTLIPVTTQHPLLLLASSHRLEFRLGRSGRYHGSGRASPPAVVAPCLTGDPALADVAVQETFVTAIEAARTDDGERRFTA